MDTTNTLKIKNCGSFIVNHYIKTTTHIDPTACQKFYIYKKLYIAIVRVIVNDKYCFPSIFTYDEKLMEKPYVLQKWISYKNNASLIVYIT